MTTLPRDLCRHNTWATAELLTYCRDLDEATLSAVVPGTFGSISKTLTHMLNSEASYLSRLMTGRSSYPWPTDDLPSIAVLAERAAVLIPLWEQFLDSDFDPDGTREGRGDDGRVFEYAAGVFLTQALHHANEHRAHICTILGALGHEPPDVSAWGYAFATGRVREQPAP
jgi:uncharacterized damage-inducible protein DinB